MYLPMDDTSVLENGGETSGFIPTIHHALTTLFVPPCQHGKGYGGLCFNW
ncbi:hypothetical protein [Paenibacillus terrae]|nr:hypothetical protein [Paenibacillus terrae]